jgi:hypothetical protein
MVTRRAHIVVPEELLQEIDGLVGVRGRSRFIQEIASREVHRLRFLRFLDENPAGWNLAEHPELNDGAAKWVERLRADDERIDHENPPD